MMRMFRRMRYSSPARKRPCLASPPPAHDFNRFNLHPRGLALRRGDGAPCAYARLLRLPVQQANAGCHGSFGRAKRERQR
jgi:hypothetical protein